MTKKPRPMPDVDERLFLQSVARALDVLECFAEAPQIKSLGDIAAATGLNKSAAQRIGLTLLARGYLERADDGGLTLGKRLLDRSFDYLRSNPVVVRATPVLIELRKRAGERVDFSLFDDISTIHTIRMQSKRETFYATLPGRRIPTFISSGGRACMARMPDDVVDDILKRSDRKPLTPKTLTKIPAIWQKIREARADGYAYALEEAQIGEIVLGACVLDGRQRPVGAVHIAGSLSEWSVADFRKSFSPLVVEAASAISG